MTIQDITKSIEAFAPPSYQESYDNAGVQVGDSAQVCTGALLCLDITEAIIDEAIDKKCNLIIAHHPLIFAGLKKIIGKTYVERCVIKAIQNNIVLFAAHTNLDNMQWGVNHKIAERLGLERCTILAPMEASLYKLYTYVPISDVQKVRDALFEAGAGHIGNYSECSFITEGEGSFKGNEFAKPSIGNAVGPREQLKEAKLEVLVPKHLKGAVIKVLKDVHPYEEVAYELVLIDNPNQTLGAGLLAYLPKPMPAEEFLKKIKDNMHVACIKYTRLNKKEIAKVALCGGSGSFLLKNAIAAQADIFITADYKYHQFFDAENNIIIADIGHYESEQFTVALFKEILEKQFAAQLPIFMTEVNTNPVQYFT